MKLFVGESTEILTVCQIIKKKISSASQLFCPSVPGYNQTLKHFYSSSSMLSAFSFVPGTAKDVTTIVSYIILRHTVQIDQTIYFSRVPGQ